MAVEEQMAKVRAFVERGKIEENGRMRRLLRGKRKREIVTSSHKFYSRQRTSSLSGLIRLHFGCTLAACGKVVKTEGHSIIHLWGHHDFITSIN